MIIQNIHHKGKYTVSRQDWDEMGAAQKSFRIIDANDNEGEGQTINNQASAVLTPPAENNTNKSRKNSKT
jgi:hypothetical protein